MDIKDLIDPSHLLAHRGFWLVPEEQNSLRAIGRAVSNGVGIEVDVRHSGSRVILSHDASVHNAPTLDQMSNLIHGISGPVALNVKSDGLVPELLSLVRSHPGVDFIAFDMSWPEMMRFIGSGIPVAIRVSEFEPLRLGDFARLGIPVIIWLDGLLSDWWIDGFSVRCLPSGSRVFVVSPELHARPGSDILPWIRSNRDDHVELFVCTDLPIV